MKLIIIGSNGMLGTYLKKYFDKKFTVISLTRDNLDLSNNKDDIKNFFVNNLAIDKNDIIINAAGIIKQRNFDLSELILVNSIFPNILAEVSKIHNSNVIHITTDCVFSGNRGNYTETSPHDCLDEYGKSKSLGENNNITNIRTSIIGEEVCNKKSLIEWVKSNKNSKINGYTNHYWNGITCLELSKFIEKIIIENNFWKGTRHIFSSEDVNKYQLVSYINEIYNLNIDIAPIEEKYCNRLLRSNFNFDKIKNLKEQLQELKEFNIF